MLKILEYKGGPFDGKIEEIDWDEEAWALFGDRPIENEEERDHVYTLRCDESGKEWLQYEGEKA